MGKQKLTSCCAIFGVLDGQLEGSEMSQKKSHVWRDSAHHGPVIRIVLPTTIMLLESSKFRSALPLNPSEKSVCPGMPQSAQMCPLKVEHI
jgi:hypothetical protein